MVSKKENYKKENVKKRKNFKKKERSCDLNHTINYMPTN